MAINYASAQPHHQGIVEGMDMDNCIGLPEPHQYGIAAIVESALLLTSYLCNFHSTVSRSTTIKDSISLSSVRTITEDVKPGCWWLEQLAPPRKGFEEEIGTRSVMSSRPREDWFCLQRTPLTNKNAPKIIGPAAK